MSVLRTAEDGELSPLLPHPVEIVFLVGIGLALLAVLAMLVVGVIVFVRGRTRETPAPDVREGDHQPAT